MMWPLAGVTAQCNMVVANGANESVATSNRRQLWRVAYLSCGGSSWPNNEMLMAAAVIGASVGVIDVS